MSVVGGMGLSILLGWSGSASASQYPGIATYHVTIEDRSAVGGTPVANEDRLTFVYSHMYPDTPWQNHFHGIGRLGSTNNRIPEPYQNDNGLGLLPGSGAFAGKYISGLAPSAFPGDPIEQEYGDIVVRPIDALFQYDNQLDPAGRTDPRPATLGNPLLHPGHYLLNTSSGAYKHSVANVNVGLELVSKTLGLSIHDEAGNELFTSSNVFTLGESASWEFKPVFAVDDDSAPGTAFSATFRLVDLDATTGGGVPSSGNFSFDFVVIPEPASAALAGLAMTGLAVRRRRNV